MRFLSTKLIIRRRYESGFYMDKIHSLSILEKILLDYKREIKRFKVLKYLNLVQLLCLIYLANDTQSNIYNVISKI